MHAAARPPLLGKPLLDGLRPRSRIGRRSPGQIWATTEPRQSWRGSWRPAGIVQIESDEVRPPTEAESKAPAGMSWLRLWGPVTSWVQSGREPRLRGR